MLWIVPSIAQQPSEQVGLDSLRWRKAMVLGGGISLSAASLVGLNNAWYSQYDQTSFHWFNDNKEWYGHDKVGHVTSAYYIARGSASGLRWAGYDRKKSAIWASTVSIAYLSTVEILDGHSAQWGASPGDAMANLVGVGLYLGQELTIGKQVVYPQFSFHRTSLAEKRPSLLGENWTERWLKDYNGQTYWLTFDVSQFRPKSNWPSWLGFSAGYGIDGFVSADSDISVDLGEDPRSRWVFAPNILLQNIRWKRKSMRTLSGVLILFKFPTPAVEWSKDGLSLHPFYF